MTVTANRVWRLGKRPTTTISDENLSMSTESVPAVAPGMVVLRTKYLSLDPANRIWMSERESYMEPVGLGAPMKGIVLAQVVESGADTLAAGDYVITLADWADYSLVPAEGLEKFQVPEGVPLRDHFALMGAVGPTAYIGLLDFGMPKPGETVVVSTAAGAVGSIVGQIAKIKGCRAVGITGSDEKCDWITGTLGYDAAINYKTQNLDEALAKACPNGVDVFFDNVGGDQLNTVMGRMNLYGRIIQCGMIAQYNTEETVPGPSNYPLVLMNRLKVSGFICFDHLERYPQAIADLTQWIREGKLRYRLDEVDGLENALSAVRKLFDGSNKGKLLVKVSAA